MREPEDKWRRTGRPTASEMSFVYYCLGQLDLSVVEIASRMEVPHSQVFLWVRGARRMSPVFLERLKACLSELGVERQYSQTQLGIVKALFCFIEYQNQVLFFDESKSPFDIFASNPPSYRETQYVALIGDIVMSKRLRDRAGAQEWLQNRLDQINLRFEDGIASRFLITLGDEFQGLLTKPTNLPEIMWILTPRPSPVKFRFGVGKGVIQTPINQNAIGFDGPAWHNARNAIEWAKKSNRHAPVFRGFGDPADGLLSTLAHSLEDRRSKMSIKHHSVLVELRDGRSQIETANRLGISPQLVSYIATRKLTIYFEEERALADVLGQLEAGVFQSP